MFKIQYYNCFTIYEINTGIVRNIISLYHHVKLRSTIFLFLFNQIKLLKHTNTNLFLYHGFMEGNSKFGGFYYTHSSLSNFCLGISWIIEKRLKIVESIYLYQNLYIDILWSFFTLCFMDRACTEVLLCYSQEENSKFHEKWALTFWQKVSRKIWEKNEIPKKIFKTKWPRHLLSFWKFSSYGSYIKVSFRLIFTHFENMWKIFDVK